MMMMLIGNSRRQFVLGVYLLRMHQLETSEQ